MNAANLNITPDETQVKGFIGFFSSMDLITGLKGLATLVIGLIIVRILLKLIRQGLGKSKIPPSIHSMLCTLLRIVLDLVVVLSAANVVGIPITSFVTLLGLAGLAISLTLQGVLENLAGGVILLASQPFRVGGQAGAQEGAGGKQGRILAQEGRRVGIAVRGPPVFLHPPHPPALLNRVVRVWQR